jgi:acetyl-CoA C-acetyltransferase
MWTVHSYAGDYNPLHDHGTRSFMGLSCILFLKVPPQIEAIGLPSEEMIAAGVTPGFQGLNGASGAVDGFIFDDELVPVSVPQRKGDPIIVDIDEGFRSDATMESMARLKPLTEGGIVTAGNASQQNDAAAACLVVAEDKLAELNLEPMGYLVGWAAAGCHPATMGIGPVPAVEKLMQRTGITWKDIDLVELNEAFACQVLSVLKGWDWHDSDKLNVNGSGISLGHPIGATGGRILATMLHELHRRQGKYALETMCIGGGQGIAALFERA